MHLEISTALKRMGANTVVYTLIFNTGIALFLYFIEFKGISFWHTFIFSQCIGCSICLTIMALFAIFRPNRTITQALTLFASLVTGSVVGGSLGLLFTENQIAALDGNVDALFYPILLGLVFGGIISYFFISRHKILESETLIQQERMQRLAAEKETAETQLRLLQAQVEPHFLFNTLSNIISLLEDDVEKGKFMLIDLTCYLRASLKKTRRGKQYLRAGAGPDSRVYEHF
jgi:sensor histidine kinase YesM